MLCASGRCSQPLQTGSIRKAFLERSSLFRARSVFAVAEGTWRALYYAIPKPHRVFFHRLTTLFLARLTYFLCSNEVGWMAGLLAGRPAGLLDGCLAEWLSRGSEFRRQPACLPHWLSGWLTRLPAGEQMVTFYGRSTVKWS